MAASVERQERQAPLPKAMQGGWVNADDRSTRLVIEGGEILCYGGRVEYDYKDISTVDEAVTVKFGVADVSREDAFQRANITGMALTPEGDLFVWNVKFGDVFVRPPLSS